MNKSEQSLLAQVAKRPDLFEDSFYSFSKLMHPRFYLDDRDYLIDMCNRLQAFIYGNDKRFLVMTVPPRHGKSLTAQNLTAWLFGLDNRNKVMTGSYNERLSGIFARSVRNMIQTEGVGNNLVYSDIFPDTKVKYGEASASMWSLAGSDEVNYLATSPGATATGLGVNTLIIDDIIKSADEAYNENRLQDLWEWYNNTMMQRLEGDWRVIIIMTRWATGDLAGRVLADYGDKVEHISYSAVQPDGSMLCDAVLDAETFALKTQEMNPDIVEANYNQRPIDIRGRLYPTLNTYELETLVETDAWKNAPVQAICDTADAGTDYLCLMVYKVIDNEAYIIDTVFTQEDMDTTEELVADSLYLNNVNSVTFEANNGGRLFSKNVEKRIMSKYGTNKTIIETVTQSSNKEARIMTSSAWVNKHVYMPLGWRNKWRELHDNITSYQAKGKNKHDDGADVLAYIFESITDKKELVFYGSLDRGVEPGRGVFSW